MMPSSTSSTPAAPRSWLFVPANEPARVEKALQSGADAVLVDLEDSVPDEAKRHARSVIRSLAQASSARQIWVRVNSRHTGLFEEDLAAAAANPQVRGVLVPKVEEAQDLGPPALLAAGRQQALAQGALIESARGVMNLFTVLEASPCVTFAMFGGAEGADLMTDLQCAWSLEGPELLHARQHTLLACRAAGVLPVDGVFSRIDDVDGLAQDCRLSRRLGFRSRAVVSPRQIAPVNEIYAPTPDELARARQIVDAFDAALQQGAAAIRLEGRLIDYAMYHAACRLLGLERPAQRHTFTV